MKKKILFIIKDKKTYENIIENTDKFSEFNDKFVISLNRIFFEKIKNQKFFKKKNIYDGNDLIETNINLKGEKISSILKKSFVKNSDFYLSKFSELNNADNFFYDYLVNEVISDIIKKNNITYVYNYFRVKKIYKKENFNYFKSKKIDSKMIFFFSCLFISFKNFFKEILLSLVLKKSFLAKEKLVVANLKDNWFKNKNYYQYIYVHNYKNKLDYSYLISGLRNNTNAHNNVLKYLKTINEIQKQKNIFLIESWIGILSIVKNYFFGYLLFFKKYQELKKFFLKNKFTNYNEIICIFYLIDYPKNKNLENAYSKFFLAHRAIKKLCIPIFELNDGKIACKIANDFNIKTYGIQHGYFNNWHKWRFFFNLNACSSLSKNFFPKNVFFFGSNTLKWYGNIKFISKKIIGNQRTPNYPIKYNFEKAKDNYILVLLDLRDWHEKIDLLFRIFDKTKYTLFIKAHPFTALKVKNLISKKKLNKNFIFLEDISFFKNKYPKFILSSDTGAIVEYTQAGWPCFLMDNITKPNISPLLNNNKNLIRFNLTKKILFNLDKIKKSHLKKYVKNQQYYSKKHIRYIGLRAAREFQKYF